MNEMASAAQSGGQASSTHRLRIAHAKVYLSPATRTELKRNTYVAHVVFVLKDQVDNASIPINPLGLTTTYFREDQAFVNDAGRTP